MASKKGGRSRAGRGREDPPDVKLSKFLSYVCRHGAEKLGLQVHEGGFITVSDILRLPQGQRYTEEDVRRVVANNDKQRYALKEEAGQLWIRANQGHTMEVSGLELRPVTSAEDVPIVVHGTYHKAWQQIRHQGLSRMQRNHIHFATGLPGDSGVISGMRSSCQVLIYIDLQKALDGELLQSPLAMQQTTDQVELSLSSAFNLSSDGYKFYLSANDVVLCPGNEQGLLPPPYFSKVIELPSGRQLS